MALFKCKMCGGELQIEDGATVGICRFCGSKQTLPKLDDDRRANLYDRANHFRRANEFDKAAGIYEQILNEEPDDAEAYWSLLLCEFGIEYVEDPQTGKRIPTVHRAQFTSVFDNENYKSAMEHADADQRMVYEDEAKAINEIQKGILAISQKEDPFDVFICYKETDKDGKRTVDSVLANELYHQLTQEGFKVFFSRITLEDKLGVAYEPYIFAALNSARVMVVIGTKPEYFNAVWVKNEWSRFLSLIKKSNGHKTLIPAYKDMDPYDLPEEFSHLQAQDMSKLGFMQDLIRGIRKLVNKQEPAPAARGKAAAGSIEPLLKRAFIFLGDGNWNEADIYCEKVLDLDPENANAYLGKLMAKLRVREKEALVNCARPFDDDPNYKKVIKYGDDKMTDTMVGYITAINDRNEKERIRSIYSSALTTMHNAVKSEDFGKAASLFSSIPGYENADELAVQCQQQSETAANNEMYDKGVMRMGGQSISNYEQALSYFESISGWKDADDLAEECRQRIADLKEQAEIDRKDTVYDLALKKMYSSSNEDIIYAIDQFKSIPGWRDADYKAQLSLNRLDNSRLRSVISDKVERCDTMLANTGKSRTAGLVFKTFIGLLIFALFVAGSFFIPKIDLYSQADDSFEVVVAFMLTKPMLTALVFVIAAFPLAYSIWTMTRIAKSGKDLGFSHSVGKIKNELIQMLQRINADDTARLFPQYDFENFGKNYTDKLDELERKNRNGPKNVMYGLYKVVSVISPAIFALYVGTIFIALTNGIFVGVCKFNNKVVALILTIVAAALYLGVIIYRFYETFDWHAYRGELFIFGIGTPIIGAGVLFCIGVVFSGGVSFWSVVGGIVLLLIMFGIWKLYNMFVEWLWTL